MPIETTKPKRSGLWILIGLVLGLLCGVFFGDYCQPLQVLGNAYVGLLQMTVLPYLTLSLIGKMGRLNMRQAKKLGLASLIVLLVLWTVGILLIVAVSSFLPPIEGASFFSPPTEQTVELEQDYLSRFIPTNVFRSLSEEFVPGIVVFCLFFGAALMMVPGKERLLDLFDLCCDGIGRINAFLVRLAPVGLFLLTAAATGTLRVEEIARLQGYLIMFTLACVVATFGILPLLISSLTTLRYRDILNAAQEPLLTVLATGKLFVVLPQIIDKCDELLRKIERTRTDSQKGSEETAASIVVPLAYPFPHLGKILPFLFISFSAWHVGRGLTAGQTASMAATGTVSSFASPLITIPFLLDQYQLPQDLMPLFILPGFITMRLADVVGVLHLMALTLIVSQMLSGHLRLRLGRLAITVAATLLCLAIAGATCRSYLASTTLEYDLNKRLLSLEIPSPHEDTVVYSDDKDVPRRAASEISTRQRVRTEGVLRIGYQPDRLPYCFFNNQQQLVGLDVELMHRLARRLQVRLEFIPYASNSVIEQLETGEIDMAIGGLMMKPERLLKLGFTQPYQTATIAIVLPDHRRGEFSTWNAAQMSNDVKLGVVYEDLATATRRQLPNARIEVVDSFRSFFEDRHQPLDGLIMAAEEGAAWNVLYPEHTVVIPKPVIQRPVGMAVRLSDSDWLRFLDRWLDFERMEGSNDRLAAYWIQGEGTKKQGPRWCIMRDVLHWVP